METSLVDGVMNYYTKAVPLGDIWKRLNDMTRTMHREGNRLFGDLKTDNVMFAKQGKRNNKGDVNLLRYVDLGHVTSYASVEKGDKAAQGTPLYWSIHNHNGVSQSRRDEYFANALMVAECGIRVHARNEGTAYKYKAKTPGQPDAYLPWATLKSDAAIRDSMKQVLDLGSEFYKRMPMQMRKPIHNVITYCHELDYKDNADLDELDAMIGNKLVIAVGGGSGQSGRQPATKKRRVAKVPPAAAAEAEPVSARAARAAKRQSAASFKSPPQQMVDLTYDSDDDQKPAAQPKKTTRAKRKGKAVDSDDDDDDDDQKAKPKAKIVPFMGETAPKNAAKKSAAGKAPNKPKSDGPIIAPYMGTAAPKAASEKSAAGKAAGKSNIQIVPYMGENSSKYLAPQPTKRGTKGAPKAPAAAADRIPNGTPVPLTLNAVRRMRSTANDGDVEMEDCDNTAEAENVEPMDVDDEEVTNVRTMRPRRAKR